MKLKYKITFTVTVILAITSWVIAIYYWDKLPSVIPTHFGISGQADGWADKSIFQVYLIPFLQSLISGLFVFVYYKPQYSNMPTTMWLKTLDKRHKDRAYDLIRTTMAGVSIIVGFLFTYLTYGMNLAAINKGLGLSSEIMFSIIGIMIAWLVFWTIKSYRVTKKTVDSQSEK